MSNKHSNFRIKTNNQNVRHRTEVLQINNNSTASKNTNCNPDSFGLTSPISLAEPTTSEIKRTNELKEVLSSCNIFETTNERNHRAEVLSSLDAIVKQWIKDTSIKQGMQAGVANQVGGKIYTFGSYRLGVNLKGADIDVLCVVPYNIQRHDYFTSFVDLLKSQAKVTDLRAVKEAFVPVIKLVFDSIEIDMVFARLHLIRIPELLKLNDDKLLINIDTKSVRSLNGCRVTDEIIRLVPNAENFKLTLMAVKLWAKNKKIYSNASGYLGGVSWAMLVARTCQVYPNATASTLLEKFFKIFSMWPWPLPMLLKKPDNINLGLSVWDPRINLADRDHWMPIITPAYPQQNSTFNVSLSTRRIIQQEIENGLSVMKEINADKTTWNKLFEPLNFFARYKHYIVILASSATAEDQLKWCGLVEAKIRNLTTILETNPNVTLVHINPETFPPLIPEPGKHVSMWFFGLQFQQKENLSIDITTDLKTFIEATMQQAHEIRLLKKGMTIDIKYVKKKELTNYVTPSLLKKERKSLSGNNRIDKIISNNSAPSRCQSDLTPKKRKLDENVNRDVNSIDKKLKLELPNRSLISA